MTQLLSGGADIATVKPEAQVQAWREGERVINVWRLLDPVFGIVARRDRGISAIEDLRGKTLGTLGMDSAGRHAAVALAAAHGIAESEFEWVVTPDIGSMAVALLNNHADGLASWDVANWMLAQRIPHIAEHFVWFPADRHALGDNWATTPEFYEANFDTLVAFFTAMRKGQIYMEHYPEQAIEMAVKHIPEPGDPVLNREIIRLRLEKIVPHGQWDHDDLKQRLQLFEGLGMLGVRVDTIPIEELFPNDVAQRVERRVRGWIPER